MEDIMGLFLRGRLLDKKGDGEAIEDTMGLRLSGGAIEDSMGFHLRGMGHRGHHGSVIKVGGGV